MLTMTAEQDQEVGAVKILFKKKKCSRFTGLLMNSTQENLPWQRKSDRHRTLLHSFLMIPSHGFKVSKLERPGTQE